MRKIKDILPKPSDAIQAMIDGLLEQSKRKNFKVEMGTFGEAGFDDVCFGCAATCTVQKAFGYNFASYEIEGVEKRASAIKADQEELSDFEDAIDSFRMGYAGRLLVFYGYHLDNAVASSMWQGDWDMDTYNWMDEMPRVESYLDKLKAVGL